MTAAHTIELLESLLTAEGNLLLWRSHEDSGPPLFFVWSTKLRGGFAKGKPTIGEALVAFQQNNKDALAAKSKPFTHSSSAPGNRPALEHHHA